MFFNSTDEIVNIASKVGTTIFVIPKDEKVEIKGALVLQPEEKSVITIEQVRNILSRINNRQTKDVFILVRPADLMNDAAANALLKSLEEPNEKIHFVLVTDSPSKILATILSRAEIYFLKTDKDFNKLVSVDEKDKDLAKRLLAAKPSELVDIAEEIAKKKDGVRNYAMDILGIAIEMLYKSYFLTEKEVFIRKLPKFLAAYDAISRNGHVKLQIVSNLC